MGLNLNININGAKKGLATPPVPTIGTLVVISDTQINIPVTSSYPYEVWYSTDNVTYTKHGDGTTTPYEATGLTAGTLYYFKARGVNGSKLSEFSTAYSATTFDANAIAFLTAAEITDQTQRVALDTFVKDLKAINAVQAGFVDFDTPANSIIKACYPFIGESNNSHKWNLIVPVDSDESYRLEYNGTVNSNADGIYSNAVHASYADTNFPTNNFSVNDYGIDIYISKMPKQTNYFCDVGVNDGSVLFGYLSNQLTFITKCYNFPTQIQITSTNTSTDNYCNKLGLHSINKKSNNDGLDIFINGFKAYDGDTISDAVLGTSTIKLLSLPNNIGSDRTIGYSCLRSSVSDEVLQLYSFSVQKLMTSLNRGFRNVRVLGEGHSMMIQSDVIRRTFNILSGDTSYRIKKYINNATAGLQCQQLDGRISTKITPYFEAGYNNIAIIWCGTNDLATIGVNVVTDTFNEINSYNENLITLGWTTIILTCTPRYHATDQTGFDSQRTSFNNLIKTSLNINSYVLDLDLCSELSDFNNTTYYSDKLHTTEAGAEIVASAIVPIIKSILTT